jgi:two-component system OmpR family response regulator
LNILVIEDDFETAAHIARGLAGHGHQVECADDGRTGLVRASEDRFDVLVVDRLLPGYDGLTILRTLRLGRIMTPFLFLTAVGGVTDRIQGLHAGADDYLVKPFDLGELKARVEALGRRPSRSAAPNTALSAQSVQLDRLTRKVSVAGAPVELTNSEFKMLETLLLNLGAPVSKAMLLERVFDLESQAPSTIIEPHISRLRAKLDRPGEPDVIRTVRGVGYTILPD